jgi:hypothetical protein
MEQVDVVTSTSPRNQWSRARLARGSRDFKESDVDPAEGRARRDRNVIAFDTAFVPPRARV